MATPHTASEASVPVDIAGPQIYSPHRFTTQARKIDDTTMSLFIEATGDDNIVHLQDRVARSIPKLRLTGRVVHGKLVQSIGMDLLRREETTRYPDLLPIIIQETWEFKAPVYPDEEIRVHFTRTGILRANRPMTYELSIFVLRNENEITVQVGTAKAMILLIPSQ